MSEDTKTPTEAKGDLDQWATGFMCGAVSMAMFAVGLLIAASGRIK